MILSILVNILIAVFVFAAARAHARKSPPRVILRYFTALSNLFCALAALAVALCRICGAVPQAVLLLKYVGTAAVTVTMLTVLFFLGPTIGYKPLLTGPDFWLHLACPLLALLSYFLWDRPEAPFGVTFLAALPVVLYGALYLCKVLLAPEGRRWNDFYGFNRGGRWALSYIVMVAGAYLIGVVLWAI